MNLKHKVESEIQEGIHKYITALSEMALPNSKSLQNSLVEAKHSETLCEAKLGILQAAIKSYDQILVDRGEWERQPEGPPAKLNGLLSLRIESIGNLESDMDAAEAIKSLLISCSVEGRVCWEGKMKRREEKCQLSSEAGVPIRLDNVGVNSDFEILIRTKELKPTGFVFFELGWLLAKGATRVEFRDTLALEPEGFIKLTLRYEPDQQKPGNMASLTTKLEEDLSSLRLQPRTDLERHGAIKRKRIARLGHLLYSKKIYKLMKCAVCSEFLYHTSAYRCEHCRFFCHKRCIDEILTKCVSAADVDLEESNPLADLTYNVAHSFVASHSLMPNWCMHCGKFGRKGFYKCKACDNTCHIACAHNVPNLCGLSVSLPQLAALRLQSRASVVARESKTSLTNLTAADEQTRSIKDYDILKLLGTGNFGKVYLARERASRRCVAIKVVRKSATVDLDELENIETEHEVFRLASLEAHPFLAHLLTFFQDSSRFYFVMEYIGGGDLMFHIQKRKFTLSEARFFAAEVLLAIEYLHKHNIIYRDLKLDNILLTAEGHAKLTDYGLCKLGMDWKATTTTFCGTPEFIAPEILSESSYTRAADWWAFGVLVYELVLGQSPFSGRSESEIFRSILSGRVYFPSGVDHDAKDLIQRLLVRNAKIRLGAGPTDSSALRKHPFFKHVDFNRLIMKLDKSPFLPIMRSPSDVGNFDIEFTEKSIDLSPTASLKIPSPDPVSSSFSDDN